MTDSAHPERFETVADVIRVVIRTAADELVATEPAAMDDLPDGVHQHRTRVRRLRSVLAGFREYLDELATHDLRVRLGEWGGQLGVVRDIEVRAQVAASAMDRLGIHDTDARHRLVDAEEADYRRAHARLRELRGSPRAIARAVAIARYADDPPTTRTAETEAAALLGVVRREARRVHRAAKRSDGSTEALHEVRKAARRLRYVGEALHAASPTQFGQAIAELAAAGEEVHDTLGDRRDEEIFLRRLEISRAHAGRSGESVQPYDDLAAGSAREAERRRDELDEALTRIREAAKSA